MKPERRAWGQINWWPNTAIVSWTRGSLTFLLLASSPTIPPHYFQSSPPSSVTCSCDTLWHASECLEFVGRQTEHWKNVRLCAESLKRWTCVYLHVFVCWESLTCKHRRPSAQLCSCLYPYVKVQRWTEKNRMFASKKGQSPTWQTQREKPARPLSIYLTNNRAEQTDNNPRLRWAAKNTVKVHLPVSTH